MGKRSERESGPHWHFDCRIESELPENRVVGLRFLASTGFALAAAVSFLLATWFLYRDITLHYQITDWYQRIEDARGQMRDIDTMQAEYSRESAKIDAAYSVMKRNYVVSAFLANLGQVIPEGLEVNIIQSGDEGLMMTGTMHQSTEVASKTLGKFVKDLNANPEMAKLFSPIRLTKLARRDVDNVIEFNIVFLTKS